MIILSKYQANTAPEPVKTEESPSSGLERSSGGSEEVSGKKNLFEKANLIRKFLLPVKAMVVVVVLLFAVQVAKAVTYYSGGNNAPNLLISWWLNNNGTGAHPSNFTTAGNTFIIQAAHTMTTTAAWTVSGAGSGVQVNGVLVASSAVTAPTWTFNNGSTYTHAQNGGTIPTATWNAASTCNITGITNATALAGLGQPFGNFTWNCAGQLATGPNFYLASNMTINGNFTVSSTGATNDHTQYSLRMSNTVTGYTMNVTGNVVISNIAAFKLNNNTGICTMNIGGNLTLNNSATFVIVSGTVNSTVNVTGNVNILGGVFILKEDPNVTIGTLNIKGNFTQSAGSISRLDGPNGTGAVNFNGTTTQTYSKTGGLIVSTINFTVNSGSTLDVGTSLIDGSDGAFTLSSGAGIITAHAQGLSTTGATGSIQVTGTRTYSAGANYTYNASGAQATGDGLPTAAITGGVTIASGAIVTSTNAIIVTSPASLTVNGTLTPGAATQAFSGTGTLTGTGTVQVNKTAATADFLSQYTESTKTLTGLTVEYTVLTGAQVVSSTTYNNLKLNNTSSTNTTGGNVTVNGTLTTTAGGTLNMGTNLLSGTLTTVTNGGTIQTQNTTATPIPTGKAWGGTVLFDGVAQTVSTGTYNNLTLSGSGTKSMTAGTSVTSNLSIAPTGTATASVAAGQNLTVGTLTLGGEGTINGTWGSTSSSPSATNQNNTYFAATTGYITVAASTCSSPTITLGSNPSVCIGTITANLPYSATTGTPDKYSIVFDAAAITAGFANVTNATLGVSPIVITVPAAPVGGAATFNATLTVKRAKTGCISSGSAIQIRVNPVIANNTVSAVQTICSGSTPTSLTGTLPTGGSGSFVYLWESSTTSAVAGFATATGTSNAQNYTPGSLAQTTWYRRTVTSGGCSNIATAIQIAINPSPVINLTVGGTSPISSGTSTNITVALSVVGTNYQLRNNTGNVNVGSPVAGTGGTINLPTGNLIANTTFNVLATISSTGCSAQLTGTFTVTISASCITSQPSSVTICSGAATSFSVVATGSPTYQWQVSTDNGVSWTNITAAGADPVYAGWTTATLTLTSTVPSNNGYQYRCVTSCGTSSAATLTLQIINITYKLSASPGLVSIAGSSTLALSGSQTNVNYQLRTGTTAIGSPVAGTGSSISFATVNPTTSTQYNVLATTSTGGCSAQITDTRTITVNETGIIISLTTCNGQPGLNFFTNSEFGTTATNNYQTPDQGKFPGVILGNPLGGYTNYTYGLVSDAIPDGNYVIANSTAGMYRAPQQIMGTDVWLYTEDRSSTPGTGHMYIVNASNTPGEFYTETLTNLCENTRYEFSAEMINLYAANWVPYGPDYLSYFPIDGQGNRYSILPNVDFMLDGKVALNTGNIMNDGNWKTFGFTFRTAPGQTSITLSMRNNSTGGIGNDIALDNIIMRSCGPVIDIEIETTLPVCPGVAVTMSANLIASDYLTPEYQWQISTDNGVTWNNISGATGSSYTSNNPAYGDMFRFIVGETIPNLSNPNCSVPSNPVSITTTAGITSTTPGSVCGSGTVTLGATANSGSTINWYANLTGGTSLGTGNSFTTPTISTTTTYYVEATNGGCTSNPRTPVIATVNSGFTASVSISASTGNSICNGTSVTFTATPTNGGATPTYQWKLNGADVGTNSPTYTNNSLVDGNIVSCVMTSSISGCISGSPATSNTITMAVGTSMTASVSISANPGNTICQGTSVTFTAVATNGGATPNYQWKNNAIDIFGAVSNIYTTSSLVQSDVITCVMTTSLPCATGSPATSNGITMTVDLVPTTATVGSAQNLYCTLLSAALGGNTPANGTGAWTKISGPGTVTFSASTTGSSTATADAYGTYVLRWTISNGTCTPSTADITVNYYTTPTASISGTTSVCQNQTAPNITFTNPQTLPVTITYNINGANQTTINVGASTTATVTAPITVAGVFAYNLVSVVYQAAPSCSNTISGTATVTVIAFGSWLGGTNTDWNTASNWSCSFIPVLTTNVQIPNVTNKPILSTGAVGTAKNIVIESGSSLTVVGNILQIAGTITNSGGTFTATAGTVEMIGSGAQAIGANVFAGNTIMNLTINNSAGVTLQGPLSVTGIVKATAGDLSSGGNLTLVSNASQTALIDGSGAGSVTGGVTMQRYLSSGLGYKYFSSPFSDADVAAFSSYLSTNATIPKFYAYDEDNHRDSSNSVAYMSGWVNYAGTLSPMYGYAANLGDVSSAKTVSITGTVNNGSKSVTLYNHNRKYTKGFNLVGNPYPSPIDWGAASGWTKTNIDGAIYFFNASGTQYTGAYSSSVNGIGSGIIPSMQGFFVHVTNGSYPVTATLGMNNNVRVNNDLSSGFSKSGYSGDTRPIISLTAGYADEKNPIDPVVVYFDEKATIEFNSKLDALKLMNTDVKVPNFYALSADANQLSIRAIPYPDSMSVVPLGLKTEQAGWISFRATGIENMPPGLQIYFSDNKTGIHTDLLQSTGCRLNMIAGTDEKRFSLIFSKRVLSDTQGSNDAFVVYSSDGKLIVSFTGTEGEKGDLIINNMIGQELWRKQIIGTGIHEFDPQLKTGVYIVSFYSGKDIYSKKVLITNQ